MTKTVAFLDPTRKLVDEVTDWLCARMETDAVGALSLAHLMVVVPTAQSGRELRLRLARRVAERHQAAVLPPRIVLPMRVIAPADDAGLEVATVAQLRAAFLKFVEGRPRRSTVDGRVALGEWRTLFRAEYIADVKSHLSFFDQLLDIWRILAGGGLVMRDVAENAAARNELEGAIGDELTRWRELGEFETAFFDFLHGLGLRHEAEAIHAAKTSAAALPEDVREVVLPALADPVAVLYDVLMQQRDGLKVTVLLHARREDARKFDEWGRPSVGAWTGKDAPVLDGIRDEDVVRAGTDTELAAKVAGDFPGAGTDLALPALGLCDDKLHAELAAAFLNVGYELYNPERHALAVSSLGRLVAGLTAIHAARDGEIPWDAFVSVLRLDDVMAAVRAQCPKTVAGNRPSRMDILRGLDICRNAFLPHALPPDAAFDRTRLKRFEVEIVRSFQIAACTFLKMVADARTQSTGAAGFVRVMLQTIYAARSPSGDAKEFLSAAEKTREMLQQLEDPRLAELGLSDAALTGLLRKTLAEAAYSLEPDSPQALKTEGWLELVWSAADKIALAGFHEGAVPDAVVGHAFLPDSLRKALDLTTNDRRLARDASLLADLLAARAAQPGSVRAYVSQANNAGDIHRPSRLLFFVPPERLAQRARALFGDLPPAEPMPPRRMAEAWRPRLPDSVKVPGTNGEHPDGELSASAIDTWLKCPFSYLLKYGLGMNRVTEKDELEANDFGTLVHLALERYAREQLARTARGLAQLHEVGDIADSLCGIMADIRAGYGANASVNLRLQLDAAEGRLKSFARIQAAWAQAGWRIAAEPELRFQARPFAGEGDCDVEMKGSVDRIDFKEGVGYRLIDYKTWDSRSGATGRILRKGAAQEDHAARLHLPLAEVGGKPRRFLSVQLPLYARCLEVAFPERFMGEGGSRIADWCYLLLGSTPQDVVVLGSMDDQKPFEAVASKEKVKLPELREIALETARTAIRRIRGNVFWPPGPGEEWKYDLKDVLSISPEADFPEGTPWRDAQEAKLEALNPKDEVRA